MLSRFAAILVLAAPFTAITGCRQKLPGGATEPSAPAITAATPVIFPELGPARTIKPGIRFQEATVQRGNKPMKVWFYQPEKATEKLALVLVPPAGSTLLAGMDLSDGDREEHFPYVKAGFAVASFEIDGAAKGETDGAVLTGAREFRDAKAGIVNAQTALDFILAKAPNIDPNRVYIAGHSSAATLSLLAAEYEPRFKACAAYAPVADVEARVAQAIPIVDRAIPGYKDFLRFSSPKTHAEKLTCPVFLFHALDDSNVPVSQSKEFAALLKKTNPHVTFITANKGGHYDSMINEGLPKAIAWFEKLPKE